MRKAGVSRGTAARKDKEEDTEEIELSTLLDLFWNTGVRRGSLKTRGTHGRGQPAHQWLFFLNVHYLNFFSL